MKTTKNARARKNADVSDYCYMNEWLTMISRNMQQTIDIYRRLSWATMGITVQPLLIILYYNEN